MRRSPSKGKAKIAIVTCVIVAIVVVALVVYLVTPNTILSLAGIGGTSENAMIISNENSVSVTHPQFTNNDLQQYALQRINEDRKQGNLPLVELSNNEAAQVHAEDVLKTKHISHWMTNGEKPYMTYTRYSGLGAVSQNVATQGYSDSDTQDCAAGRASCSRTDPFKDIDRAEYGMMYEDSICCNNGHRDNILDKHHTSVSLGIAYDNYYFVMVQNFEDNYIQFSKPILADSKHVQLSGSLISENFDGLAVYYDESPTASVYQENRQQTSYSLGAHVATVVEPIWMGRIYKPTENEAIIYSDNWVVNEKEIDIKFDISQVMNKNGVYTVVVFFKSNNGEQFPVTTYSLFASNTPDKDSGNTAIIKAESQSTNASTENYPFDYTPWEFSSCLGENQYHIASVDKKAFCREELPKWESYCAANPESDIVRIFSACNRDRHDYLRDAIKQDNSPAS